MRPLLTAQGLRCDGIVQVFRAERRFQTTFADWAARDADEIVNVGFGLGYAHAGLSRRGPRRITLIEQASELVAHLPRGTGRQVLVGRWETLLGSALTADSVLYFDAFPVERGFQYRPREFRAYLRPLLDRLSGLPWRRAYFLAFDLRPIDFAPPAGLRVRRVRSLVLPRLAHDLAVKYASLYRVSRHP
jgi:hypothetical protein